ncbi:MAG: polysaccharide biosynthesis/export family protein [Muribaculaceae bacterium]|nr:polysaccharide biosynthesis/export family protein [Muribaculaceae bacterium]
MIQLITKLTRNLLIVGLLTLVSCGTPKDITYFQDLSYGSQISPNEQLDIKVKPEDKLAILVYSSDPTLAAQFNLVQQQTRLTSSTSSAVFSGSGTTDGRMSFYTVSPEGDINFPSLGKMHIAGMSRAEVAEYIEKELIQQGQLQDPVVTVEFVNTGISIIGEVSHPGRYDFNKDRLNIIDALAMAGDLTPFGLRENVLVIREDASGKQTTYKVDLTNMGAITNSPVYYLQQNDVIYVEPNDKKKRDTTASGNVVYTPSFWVTIGSLGISIATLIVTLTR